MVAGSTGRTTFKKRGQCIHRERDLDHRGGVGDDRPHRITKNRISTRFWSNHAKSRNHSVAGNAYIELLLVLPVLVTVFLGLVTVASLVMGNMAVSQAAQDGVTAWASGDSISSVEATVADVLQQEGVQANPVTTLVSHGGQKSVTVSIPMKILNTGTVGTVSASRTITALASPSSGGTVTGGTGRGQGGVVYHHFPRW